MDALGFPPSPPPPFVLSIAEEESREGLSRPPVVETFLPRATLDRPTLVLLSVAWRLQSPVLLGGYIVGGQDFAFILNL